MSNENLPPIPFVYRHYKKPDGTFDVTDEPLRPGENPCPVCTLEVGGKCTCNGGPEYCVAKLRYDLWAVRETMKAERAGLVGIIYRMHRLDCPPNVDNSTCALHVSCQDCWGTWLAENVSELEGGDSNER